MAIAEFVAGLFVGLILGVGLSIFYLRWKMQKQIGSIEDQMGAIMDMSDEMSDMMDPEQMGDLAQEPSENGNSEDTKDKKDE